MNNNLDKYIVTIPKNGGGVLTDVFNIEEYDPRTEKSFAESRKMYYVMPLKESVEFLRNEKLERCYITDEPEVIEYLANNKMIANVGQTEYEGTTWGSGYDSYVPQSYLTISN